MRIFLKVTRQVLVASLLLLIAGSSAQGKSSTQATTPAVQSSTQELQHRIDIVEEHLKHVEESVRSNSDASRLFITVLSVIIGLIVSVQSVFQGMILRHQWARDTEHDSREKEQDKISNTGAKAVADVLSVVKDTMDTRLIQEKEAVKEADAAKKEVQVIRGDLTRVVAHFERLARTAHDPIESMANQLAGVRRHDFKEMPDRLVEFSQLYDQYLDDLQPLAPPDLTFSAKVVYVRGIAAHYMSQPALVKKCLSEVVAHEQPDKGETPFEHSRRLANSYYYLGVNESNFSNYGDAIRLLEKANVLDLDSHDLLTRIVMAECYVFDDQLDRASGYIASDIDVTIENMKKDDFWRSYHQPLQTRSELLKANIAFLGGRGDWALKASSLLEAAYGNDSDSYYCSSSLAQAYYSSREDVRATEYFDKAYECILRRKHLETATEVRSRVLLLMVAAMCTKMGSYKKRMPEEFLDEAKKLLEQLPRRDSEQCTVFSPITKRNENRDTIATHIGQIKSGIVVQPKTK